MSTKMRPHGAIFCPAASRSKRCDESGETIVIAEKELFAKEMCDAESFFLPLSSDKLDPCQRGSIVAADTLSCYFFNKQRMMTCFYFVT